MANLSETVVRQVRATSSARAEVVAWRELLAQALALLAERDRQLAAARAQVDHLRLEVRAIISNKTIAERALAKALAALLVAELRAGLRKEAA